MANRTVFVFWGQSNARAEGNDGVPPPAIYSTPTANIKIWNTNTSAIETYDAGTNSDTVNDGAVTPQRWGPELYFCRLYLADHPTETIYICKHAVGGTSLGPTAFTDWRPDLGELFAALKTQLDALKAAIVALGDTPVVRAIIGMQGEADTTNLANANNYASNKTLFYAAARAQWGDTNTRFIDGRVSGNSPLLTYKSQVRHNQLLAAASEQDAILVDTDDLEIKPDQLHFTTFGIQTLGTHFYQAYGITDPNLVLLLFSTELNMPSSNRTQVTSVVEVTSGTTPTTPRMRTRRLTGETLFHRPTFVEQAELRADRMVADPIQTGTEDGGGINFDFHLPAAAGPLDVDISSAFYNAWNYTNSRDNDGTADSVITNVATTGEIVTCTTGTSFPIGALVRLTGFGVAGNNGVFRVTVNSATVPAFVGSGLTDEAVPPAAARMKTVGFTAPSSADITATATGLASTTFTFNTRGLFVGQWIKIGATATLNRFATAANNGFARITAIAANALTLDHLPTGWSADAATGKFIIFWVSDFIYNGTTQISQTIEKGFLGQATPTYIVNVGMVATQLTLNLEAKQKISGSLTYMGMSGTQSTTTLDAAPDAASALAGFPVFACSANVGRVYEGGSPLLGPDYVRSLTVSINNNVTPIEAVDSQGPAGIVGHECTVTGTARCYFGTNALLTKFFAGTATSLALYATKSAGGTGTSGTQAFVLNLPRVTYNGDGSPQASAKNQDVDVSFNFAAAKDESVTNAMITLSKFEYIEVLNSTTL